MNASSFSPPISDAANSGSKVKKQKIILSSLHHDNREEDDSSSGGGIIPRKQCLLVSPDVTLEDLRKESGFYFSDGFVPSNGAYCFQYYDSDEEDMVEISRNFEGYFMVEDYQKKKLTIVPSRGPKKRPREEEEEELEEDREYHNTMDKKVEKEYPIVSPSSVCRQREEDEESKQTESNESAPTHVMLSQSTTVASFTRNSNISYEEIFPLTPVESTITSTGTKPKEGHDETSSEEDLFAQTDSEEDEAAAATITVVQRMCSGSISSTTNKKDSSTGKTTSSFLSSSLSDFIEGSTPQALTAPTESDEGLLPSDHDQPNITEERTSTTLSPLKKLTLFLTMPATTPTAVETEEEDKDKELFSSGKSAALSSVNTTTAHKNRKRRAILEDSELEDYDNEDLKETQTTTSINSYRIPKKKKKRVYLADKKKDKSASLSDSDTTSGSKINAADNASGESYSLNLGTKETICLQDEMRRGTSRSTNKAAAPQNNDPKSRSVIEAANSTTTTTTSSSSSNDCGIFPGRGRKEKQKNPVGNPSLPSSSTNSSIPADPLATIESNALALDDGNNGDCSISSSALVFPPSLSSTCENNLSSVVEEGQKDEEKKTKKKKGSTSNNTATAQITDNSGEPAWEGTNLDSTGKTDGNEDNGEDYNVDFDVCSISLVDRFSSDVNSDLCPMVGKCGHSYCRQSLENWYYSRREDPKHARKNYINCVLGCKMVKKNELGQYNEVEHSSFNPRKLVSNYNLCQAIGIINQVKGEFLLLQKATSSMTATTTTTRKEKQRMEIIGKADDSFTKCCYIKANGTKCHNVFSTKAKTNLDTFHHTRAPIVGLCGHTFCVECIYEIHACFLQQSQGSYKRKWFPCPTCQQVKAFHSEQLTENIDFRAALRYWKALVRGDIELYGDEREKGEKKNRYPQLPCLEAAANVTPAIIKRNPCAFRKVQCPAKPRSTCIQRKVPELENSDDIKDTKDKELAVKREEATEEEEEECSPEDAANRNNAASMVCSGESASLCKVEAEEALPETCVSSTAYKEEEEKEATGPCASLGTALSGGETDTSQATQEWSQERELSPTCWNADKASWQVSPPRQDLAVCHESILSSSSTGSVIDGAVSSIEASCCQTVDTVPTKKKLSVAIAPSNQGLDSGDDKPPGGQEMTEGRSKMLSDGKPMDEGGSSSPSSAAVSSSSALTYRNEKEALSKRCGVPAPTAFMGVEEATEACACNTEQMENSASKPSLVNDEMNASVPTDTVSKEIDSNNDKLTTGKEVVMERTTKKRNRGKPRIGRKRSRKKKSYLLFRTAEHPAEDAENENGMLEMKEAANILAPKQTNVPKQISPTTSFFNQACLPLDPQFHPNTPLYAEQPFANVDVWPLPMESPDMSCPVFVKRMKGKTRYHPGKILGWEYVGNYKLASDHKISRNARDCGILSQKILATSLLSTRNHLHGYKLAHWRDKLIQAIEEAEDSPSENEELEVLAARVQAANGPKVIQEYLASRQLSLAARARVLGFHKYMNDVQLAKVVVMLDEFHIGRYTIEFVEYDEHVYQLCNKATTEYTASVWYDHAENVMVETESAAAKEKPPERKETPSRFAIESFCLRKYENRYLLRNCPPYYY